MFLPKTTQNLVVGAVFLVVSSASAGQGDALPKRLLAFSIYYKVEDRAFERASKTAETKYTATFSSFRDAGVDCSGRYVSYGVRSKKEFIEAWKKLASEATKENAVILAGHLFTHASKQDDGRDGLEFDGPDGEATLTNAEIAALPVLPWIKNTDGSKSGGLVLHGCNTGLVGPRKVCLAQVFAKAQGVNVNGQTGYSYFSSSDKHYKTIGAGDATVFLFGFHRGRNGLLGSGKRLDMIIYSPSGAVFHTIKGDDPLEQ